MTKHRLLCGNWAFPRVALITSLLVSLFLGLAPVRAEEEEKHSVPQDTQTGKVKRETASTATGLDKEFQESGAFKASNVTAVYQIRWLGNHIGDLTMRSTLANHQYSMTANADVTLLFGAFSWKGTTSSQGMLTAAGPMPRNYTFHYSAGEKREAVELRFSQRTVQDIIINPPPHLSAKRVPLTPAHLQNVVDPLSSSIILSQARFTTPKSDNACNRRLPIFDGKVRYDLVLSLKGTRTLSGKGRTTAQVCSVRYVPIAGHKAGKNGDEDYATGNTGIEVWLVPMPEADLMVPYYVVVPTPAGTATLVTTKFDVDTPTGRHALAKLGNDDE